jgi:hypothetical protein
MMAPMIVPVILIGVSLLMFCAAKSDRSMPSALILGMKRQDLKNVSSRDQNSLRTDRTSVFSLVRHR